MRVVDQLRRRHFRGDLRKRVEHLLFHGDDGASTGYADEAALAG
ncbi:MAG TPA: hypothetical protein VGJ26_22545 [Pirellulales bacterium]